MTRIPASQVCTDLADTLNRVAYGRERIVLHSHGKDLAALVPLADLELLRALEDQVDNEAAEQALREPGDSIPWSRLRQPGGWEGQVRISEDFDAPLPPEIQAAFEGT